MHNLLALPAGTELAEDYRILRVLGAGGFGLTYLAREETLDRSVTIKEYFPSDFAAREATLSVRPRSIDSEADYGWGLERFIEEAQTLARFDHPHINRVYRYFRANNTAYMVLHFEEGQSFKQWLASLGRAPRQAELDEIMVPLLDALEMIHAGNFLHRDIAPDNIIIRKAGGPVLIDFGSARGEMVQLSKTVSALVKPGYSPYEQYGLSGRQQGPWTDIYSLGATLYQAIAGKRPTDAPTRMVGDDYRAAASVALSSYRPQFLAAVDHALKLRPDDRPQTVAAWRRALLPPKAAAVPAKPTGVILAPAPAEPSAPLLKVPKIFKRAAEPQSPMQAEGIGAPPLPAVAKTSLKKKIVRLLEGVAARPQPGKSPDAMVPSPVALAKASAPAAKAEPAKAVVKPSVAAPPAVAAAATPASAGKNAARQVTAVVKPAAKPRAVASSTAPRRGSRGMAVKLLGGAMLSALVLSYQERIAAHWDTFVRALAPLSPASDSTASPRSGVDKKVAAARTEPKPAIAGSLGVANEPVPTPRRVEEIVLQGHRGAVNALAFATGSSALVSTGADGTLRLWNVGQAEVVRTVEAGANLTGALAVQDRMAVVGHQDGTVAIWDIERGQRLRTFKRNEALVWSVAFAGDTQRVLSAGHDWAVALWDQKRDAGPLHLFEGHDNAVQSLAYGGRGGGQSGLVATGSADKTIKLWNAADFSLTRTYRGHRDFVSAVAFSPDVANLASASFDKTIRIWSTSDSGSTRTLRGHKGRITSVAFSTDGQILASASEDGTVRLWDWKHGRVVRTLAGHTGSVRAVAFAADGKYVATSGDDGSIRLWDLTGLPRTAASRT